VADQKRELETLEAGRSRRPRSVTLIITTTTLPHCQAKLDALNAEGAGPQGAGAAGEAPKVAEIEGRSEGLAEVRKLSEMTESGKPGVGSSRSTRG